MVCIALVFSYLQVNNEHHVDNDNLLHTAAIEGLHLFEDATVRGVRLSRVYG